MQVFPFRHKHLEVLLINLHFWMTCHTLFHPLLIMVIPRVIAHLGISSIHAFYKEQLLQILKLPSNVTNTDEVTKPKLSKKCWNGYDNFIKELQIQYCSLRHLNRVKTGLITLRKTLLYVSLWRHLMDL